jgi:hypothetical protein
MINNVILVLLVSILLEVVFCSKTGTQYRLDSQFTLNLMLLLKVATTLNLWITAVISMAFIS